MQKKSEKGQALVFLALCFTAFMALAALGIDSARMYMANEKAEHLANIGCTNAASNIFHGEDGYAGLVEAVGNDLPLDAYYPNEGTGWGLTQGYELGVDNTVRVSLDYTINTSFLKIIGIQTMPVRARERCIAVADGYITPIAVKESAFYDSLNNGTSINVVGNGSQADIDPGASYRGVVFPFIWCVWLGDGRTPDSNCGYQLIFDPLTETPPSPQTAKDVLGKNCWNWNCSSQFSPVGTRLPVVAGTSSNQLCQSAAEAGLVPGADFVAIIYNGEVVKPDPSFGPWENVGVIGYGTFTVVDLDPHYNPNKANITCNSLIAVATGGIYTSYYDIPLRLQIREIPWDAQGV